jgi:hypothetical protein
MVGGGHVVEARHLFNGTARTVLNSGEEKGYSNALSKSFKKRKKAVGTMRITRIQL